MRHKIYRFFLLLALVTLSAFTLVPPAHQIPDNNRFVPEVVYQKPPVATLILQTTGGTIANGGNLCVQVKARGFNEILSMQYSMNWNPAVLKFTELNGFGVEGLSSRNFGQHAVEKGILTFSWYDQNLRGITRPDDHTLYEVCFEAIGPAGSETSVEITSKPTIIEVANVAGVFLDLRNEPDTVRVEGSKN